MNQVIEGDIAELSSTSMVRELTRAEIDQQIATAHQFPRSIQKSANNILSLVTINEQAAEECSYALPRGGKPITGPSIRLAEIISSQWGNCRVGARVVHVDRVEKYVEAEGVFHDLESNTATTSRVRRRISDKYGKLFNDDMILVTGNAACSIAKRNAILGGVPKAVWNEAYNASISTVKGDIKTLAERRDLAMKHMAAFGITPEQVYEILGIGGEKDLNLDQLVLLRSMAAGLKSGETTVEELIKTVQGEVVDRKRGDITEDPMPKKSKEKSKPKADPEEKAEDKPEDKAVPKDPPGMEGADTETKGEPEADDAKEEAPDMDKHMVHENIANAVRNDMLDATDITAVTELYKDALMAMQKEAPDVFKRLMEDADEHRAALEKATEDEGAE